MSLAAAYSVKKNSKKKQSAKSEARPMPEETANDSKDVSQNSGNKAAIQDKATSRPDIKQSQKGPKTSPIKHPKHVPISGASLRLRDQEDDLDASAAPASDKEQPSKADDEKGAQRKGPDAPALHMKRMAEGGKVSMKSAEADGVEHPAGLEKDNDQMSPPKKESMSKQMAPMLASGGSFEMSDDHHDSIAAAIMAKRGLKRLAEGGAVNGADSIYSDDSDQADLSRNAEEDANMEDQASFDALRKENYSESEGLDALDQPSDSNEHGDSREDDEENKHDKISKMRSRMNAKRQFPK